jgi:hypothetical protein
MAGQVKAAFCRTSDAIVVWRRSGDALRGYKFGKINFGKIPEWLESQEV